MRKHIYGNSFNNWFVATDTIRETFHGLEGDDVFNFYNGTSTFFTGDFTDRFLGGIGDDTMQNLQAGWNDYTLYSGLSFDGGDGYDTVSYDLTGELSGDPGAATLSASIDLSAFKTEELSVEHHEFDIAAAVGEGIEGNLGIVGTGGDETVRLTVSRAHTLFELSDVEISVALGNGDDRFEFIGEQTIMSELKINAGAGNDVVIINASTTSSPDVSRSKISTGKGNDTVVLEGMHQEVVNTGGGSDDIYILTGNFGDRPDVITTGGGQDEIFLELDEYSQVARIRDFDASKDTIIFDDQEVRNTNVTFDQVTWQNSSTPRLYMDNASGTLYFGENVLATFDGGVTLTADNFETGTWLF
jgi:uncharacterized protein YuzE